MAHPYLGSPPPIGSFFLMPKRPEQVKKQKTPAENFSFKARG